MIINPFGRWPHTLTTHDVGTSISDLPIIASPGDDTKTQVPIEHKIIASSSSNDSSHSLRGMWWHCTISLCDIMHSPLCKVGSGECLEPHMSKYDDVVFSCIVGYKLRLGVSRYS